MSDLALKIQTHVEALKFNFAAFQDILMNMDDKQKEEVLPFIYDYKTFMDIQETKFRLRMLEKQAVLGPPQIENKPETNKIGFM
jgi:hypothetical protein